MEENKKSKSLTFKDFINKTENEIKIEAILERALCDKITIETVNQKVNAQVNSINFGIKKINSKFTEKSKNYYIVKEQILDSMTRYESALKQLGEFYDGKIEQLIIRKLELQTNLVCNIVRQQYLMNRKNIKSTAEDNDKIKNVLTLGIKKAIEKIKEKKNKNKVDILDINKLRDKEEIEKEQTIKIKNSISIIDSKIEENKKLIEKANKEIFLITSEIKKLNDRKKEALFNAMEAEDKWMITKIKKPKTFEKITRFFSSRINTPKVIKKSLIDPLNERINYFIENELSNIGD
ncbi:MAG: hypothetical protein ACI4UE_00665 [Candidatus Scatovivens sp.]